MFKKLLFLSLLSPHAMDKAMDKAMKIHSPRPLKQLARKPFTITVILERGWFKNTTAEFSISDNTLVSEIKEAAYHRLKKLKKEHGKCRGKLYSMGLIAYRNPLTLYCHSHQEIRPIKGNVKITDLMKHNIDTLEFVWKQSYDFIRR